MDQEEQQQREKEQKNATLNKESPVWFPEKKIPCFLTKKTTNSPPPLIDLACLFLPEAKCEYIISQSEQKQKQKKIVKTTVHRNFSVSFYVFQLFM